MAGKSLLRRIEDYQLEIKVNIANKKMIMSLNGIVYMLGLMAELAKELENVKNTKV